MTTAAPSTALATIQPVFTDAERLALAGYLAGYRGLTREAYAVDLRQFATWCRARSLNLFAVRRADIESFARDLEARGPAPAPRSPARCALSPGSANTQSKRNSSSTHPQRTSAVCRWTTSPMSSRWTATSSARCWSLRPAAGARADLLARAERAAGVRGHRRRHRAPGRGVRAPDADHHPQGEQGRHHPAGAADRPGRSTWPSGNGPRGRCSWPRTGGDWTGMAPDGSSARSPAAPGWARPSHPTPCATRSSPPRLMAGPAAGRAGGRLARRSAHHDAV